MLFTQGSVTGELKGETMILTCPACDTKYVVKDGAIPPGGRQVRCASCRHSWHQDPDLGAAPEAEEQSIADAAMIDPSSGPEAEERAYEESVIEDEAGPVADDPDVAATPAETVGESEPAAPPERDQWPDSDAGAVEEVAPAMQPEPASSWLSGAEQADSQEFEPFYEPEPIETSRRRIPMLVWVLLFVAALAAAGWFLAPDSIRARLGLAGAGASQLEIMVTNSDRQRLASGNEGFSVTGRVINPTDQAQQVPPLKAELLDASRQHVVYSWTIDPPAQTLAPGTSAGFNSYLVDVPQGGSHLRVTLEGAA